MPGSLVLCCEARSLPTQAKGRRRSMPPGKGPARDDSQTPAGGRRKRARWGAGWGGGASFLVALLSSLLWQPCASGNLWTELKVPEHIPCSLPQCDPLCEKIETEFGEICPRAASTNLKIFGKIPDKDACKHKVKNWISGPKKSSFDEDGCGPCLLAEEKSRCNVNSGAGRGYNAGGPVARSGHTLVRYKTPLRSRYFGATMVIIFGGLDRQNQFLNDVWWRCIEDCPTIELNKRTYDEYGIAIDYQYCPYENCLWEEKGIAQEFIDWLRHKEKKPSSQRRRGMVPGRPAGRFGHTASVSQAKNQKGDGLTDIMAVFGGQSPNCTDYCTDFWYYDIMDNWWILLYGEWWGVTKEWQRMHDYAMYNQAHPRKRTEHITVVSNNHLFMWGGLSNGSFLSCCGYDERACPGQAATVKIAPDKKCGYLYDTWVTNLKEYTPFETMISVGKHATQSSTLGTGVAALAVDGNKNGHYSDTWENSVTLTNSDAQAWWQVDLGAPNMVRNVSIYNRVDKFGERLQNFYVLLSTVPFLSDQLQELLADPLVHKTHLMYIEEKEDLYIDQVAQYVRIQLAGTNYLSLAEVEIWGHPPVEDWQHTEGMKRWTPMYAEGDFPYGRDGHTLTMYSSLSGVLFGGFVKEHPYFLKDFWTMLLPEPDQLDKPVLHPILLLLLPL